MVGVPRSHGCLLCVKRRVKCDEVRPGCGNCARYGAECPGYDRSRKFVAGKHVVKPRQQAAATAHAAAAARKPESVTSSSSSSSSSGGGGYGYGHGSVLTPSTDVTSSPPGQQPPPPSTDVITIPGGAESVVVPNRLPDDRAAFVSTLIETLYLDQARMEIMFLSPWLPKVPGRLGRKITLDSAACALTLHLLGKARQDPDMIKQSRAIYGQSLFALQQALNHPVEWKTSETLCATMVLCMFECFADTSTISESWMRHAGGLAMLMQKRGPDSYLDLWDRSMLFSFRSMIVMHAIFTLQDCFIHKKKWAKVMDDITDDQVTAQPALADRIRAADSFLVHLAKVPTVLRYGYPLIMASQHGLPLDDLRAAFPRAFAEKLRHDFLHWVEQAKPALGTWTEIPSHDPSSPYPVVLAFDSPWYGSVYMGHWAAMMIVQLSLNLVEFRPEYEEANRKYANNIFRSIEYVGMGMMGGYRAGFGVRIAYFAADVPTQRWILLCLERMSTTYALSNPATFPPPAPNQYNYN